MISDLGRSERGGVVQVKLYLQQGGYEEGIMTQGTTQFSLCKGMYTMNPIHCKGWEGLGSCEEEGRGYSETCWYIQGRVKQKR